jgi:hypothetical protein
MASAAPQLAYRNLAAAEICGIRHQSGENNIIGNKHHQRQRK